MKKENKGILILLILLLIIFSVVYIFRKEIAVSLPKLVKKVDLTKDSIFRKYKAKKIKINNKDAVLFEDIIAAAADSEPRYYRVNVAVVVFDKNGERKILKNVDVAAAVIANTFSQFKTSDVNSAQGKNFLKSTIAKNLNLKFGENIVEEIYFENFVYN